MICRHCGTEIADKAIVCYRCGAGTTDPVRKPVEIRRRRSPLVPALLVLIVLAVLAWFAARHYHLFAFDLLPADPRAAQYSVLILIDCPTIHA